MEYRLPSTNMQLINTREDIKFPVNRISDNTTFNRKIQQLEQNFQALLSYCNIVDNRFPKVYDTIYNASTGVGVSSTADTSGISNHDYIDVEVFEKITGERIVILAKTNQLEFYTENGGNLTLTLTYDKVKNRGNLGFRNIGFIKLNGDKLYVYDSALETTYVYNIISLKTSDVAIENIKFLRQFFKLKNIKTFSFSNSMIYGLTNQNEIKVYNTDFNLISTHTLGYNALDISINNELFVLCEDCMRVYDLSISLKNEITTSKINTEVNKEILFSEVDEGVIYLLTDKYIKKYHESGEFIGYINISTMGGKLFLATSIISEETYDLVYALDQNKIHLFKERLEFIKLYDEVNLLDRRDLSELVIGNLELEQDFVYNSIIQKSLFNVFLLYNSLVYKPFLSRDNNGVLVYSFIENIVNPNALERIDIFYGQNEVFSYQTFNRPLQEIYRIQESIKDLIEYSVYQI